VGARGSNLALLGAPQLHCTRGARSAASGPTEELDPISVRPYVSSGRSASLLESGTASFLLTTSLGVNSPSEAAMTRQFDVVVEKDSDGYFVASVPALPGCHTQAKSLDELMERIREAITLCLEVQGVPTDELAFVGVQRVTVNA
jgi:predicted RNase H-like HicB family nuclease